MPSALQEPTTPAPPTINLKFHRQQSLVLTPKANEILYGGAAAGGKSHGIRGSMIYFGLRIPGLQCVLFRRSYPELVRNHLTGSGSFYALLQPYIKSGHVNIVRGKGEIRFWNGSQIQLAHLHREDNLTDWQGAEIHYAGFDELTHFTEAMYQYIRGRCRLGELPIPEEFQGMFPRILSGANPGGIGHTWVKRAFVKPGPYTLTQGTDEEGGMVRTYIPAKLADNPSMANDPGYAAKLMGMGDPTIVRAMLDGDWDIATGAMFGEVWRRDLHVCDPFPIPAEWTIWRGGDDGYANPSAILWLTKDKETDSYYVIDEFCKSGMLPDPLAEITLERDRAIYRLLSNGELQANPVPVEGVYDSAAFGDTGQQERIPRGQRMNVMGCKWKPAEKWPGSRVAGCQNLHRLLSINPKTGKPYLRFFRSCPQVIEVMPTLPRDKDNPEDVDTDSADDHLYDALRYGLQFKGMAFKLARVTGI